MGLKDEIGRLFRKKQPVRRGSRGGGGGSRTPADQTVVARPPVPDPQRETAPQGGPERSPAAPPAAAPPAPAAHPTPAPPAPAPAPAPARAPAPAAARAGAETQYFNVNQIRNSPVSGVLVVVDGELSGEVYPIKSGENQLGRDPGCDVVLDSMKISRQHATIVHEASENVFAIMALNEKNPVLVNDEPVDGSELSDGDLVTLGRTTLRFRTIEGL